MTGKIKHLVCLMMENRSFDHMLGFMATPQYPVDGLTGAEFCRDSTGEPVKVSDDAAVAGDFTPDPGHHYPDVNMQIFGNYQGSPAGPLMQGFVKAYEQHTHSVPKSHRIMRCYDPADPHKIPAIVKLAKEYANCDRWFSSAPGPTLPNRAFLHAATSIGRVDMNPIWRNMSKTVYELLDENGVTSTIYYSDWTVAMTFKNFASNQSKWFATFDDFLEDCEHGRLPSYSLIEPRYNDCDGGGNCGACDQHPDHDIRAGDRLIWNVYDALRNGPGWENTLLAVIYDEHGGLYDHVTPPATVNPDGKIATNVSENIQTTPPIPSFDFTRLGVRVPGILISPWIERSTIDHTVYDHTSVIATARKLFLGDQWQDKFLTERDRRANTFDHLLTRTEPRDDAPELDTAFDDVDPVPPLVSLDKPLTVHQQALVEQAFDMEQHLPAERRKSGITSIGQIKTERDASNYIRLVVEEVMGPRKRVAGQ